VEQLCKVEATADKVFVQSVLGGFKTRKQSVIQFSEPRHQNGIILYLDCTSEISLKENNGKCKGPNFFH